MDWAGLERSTNRIQHLLLVNKKHKIGGSAFVFWEFFSSILFLF